MMLTCKRAMGASWGMLIRSSCTDTSGTRSQQPESPPVPVHHHLVPYLQMLDLARSCHQLRSMVHVSSAFANAHLPENTTVYERLYQLGYGDQAIDPLALAQVSRGPRLRLARCLHPATG